MGWAWKRSENWLKLVDLGREKFSVRWLGILRGGDGWFECGGDGEVIEGRVLG